MKNVRRLVRCSLLPLSLLVSAHSQAYDFSKEDELFSRRGEGFELASQARDAYARALPQASSVEEQVYAVAQMGRLDIYRTRMIPDVDVETKKKILEACVETTRSIEKTNSQEYHYFTVSCVSLRGKFASIFGRIEWGMKLKRALGPALEAAKVDGQYKAGFEAGGILRAVAVLKSNPKTKPLGLYDPNESLRFMRLALDAPATLYRPFPEELSGSDYYENEYFTAQSEVAVALEEEKFALVDQALSRTRSTLTLIEELGAAESLPKGREPETKHYKAKLQEFADLLYRCKSERNWKTCISENLE
ncbi:MAG: hypothetical protein KA436_06490 [Oligoflexales bacterium]|nr:hypothetical protein [Oligoflexales bacterium]